MAYKYTEVTGDDDEEKTDNGNGGGSSSAPQGPSIGTVMGGSSSGPQQGGSSSTTPKPQSAQEQSGTGFVNLKSWLDAGQGRDKSITAASDKALGGEREGLNKAVTDTTAQVDQNKPVTLSTTTEAAATGGDAAKLALDREAAGTKTNLGDVLGQSYSGPTGLTWTAGSGVDDAKMLSSADTAGATLARGNQTGYGQGLRALDTALYGADPASVAAMGNTATGLKTLSDDADKADTDINTKATATAKSIDDTREAARSSLSGYRDDILKGVDARAAARNASLTSAFNDTSAPPGMQLGAWNGATPGSATRTNIAGQGERQQLSALDKFLGGGDGTTYDTTSPGTFVDGGYARTPLVAPPPIQSPEKVTPDVARSYNGVTLPADPTATAAANSRGADIVRDPNSGQYFNRSTGEWYTPDQVTLDANGVVQAAGGKQQRGSVLEYDPTSGKVRNARTGELYDASTVDMVNGTVGGRKINPDTGEWA